MKCNNCGREYSGNFCPSCGKNSQFNQVQQQNLGQRCPKCGSSNLQVINEVHGKGVSGLKVCLCGLFGLCGAGKTKNKTFWVCQNCGNKFKI